MTGPAAPRWNPAMAEAYERWLVPTVFGPFARETAARVAAGPPHPPQRVLEVAAGCGAVTRELVAALPEASVTATDLNAAMVQVGKDVVPMATWLAADAMSLPWPEGTFDAVVCQFGVMFFPDRPAGLRELGRVMTSAGRLTALTWDVLELHEPGAVVVRAIGDVLGSAPPFLAEIPHGYADRSQIREDVAASGLELVALDDLALTAPSSARQLAEGFCRGTPMRAALEDAGDLDEVTDAVAQRLEQLEGEAPRERSMTAIVITARHPGPGH